MTILSNRANWFVKRRLFTDEFWLTAVEEFIMIGRDTIRKYALDAAASISRRINQYGKFD